MKSNAGRLQQPQRVGATKDVASKCAISPQSPEPPRR